MDFMKKTLNQIDIHEDNIKNDKVCTLEELKQHIDELEAKYANNNIR